MKAYINRGRSFIRITSGGRDADGTWLLTKDGHIDHRSVTKTNAPALIRWQFGIEAALRAWRRDGKPRIYHYDMDTQERIEA